MAAGADASGRLSEFQREWCRNVFKKLTAKKIADPFKRTAPDPNQKVADPPDLPDLETCRARFDNEEYRSVIEWGLDIRKVFSGHLQHHPPGHPLFQMAWDLQEWFEKRFAEFPRSSHELWVMNLEKARHKVQRLIAKAPSMDPPPYDYVPKQPAG
jgi:hypothetical protein